MRTVNLLHLLCLFVTCEPLMLKKECQHDEVHRSCSFYEEYTCWESEALAQRVKASPKRLAHCRAGCYCKRGLVRAYPQGKCIIAQACRNMELSAVMEKIPADFSYE